jgi:hypothetical protein
MAHWGGGRGLSRKKMQEMIMPLTLQVNVKENVHTNFGTLLNNKILTLLNGKYKNTNLYR